MADNTPTVLLVEDDHQFGNELKDTLEFKNYRVDLESHGDKALILFQDSKFDVIIIDVGIPGLGGLDLAKEIR